MKPELDLILEYLRSSLGSSFYWAGTEEIDWQVFENLAIHHRLLLIINKVISNNDLMLPADIQKKLKGYHAASEKHLFILTSSLIRCVKHLETAGVAAIPFKGAALNQQVYGDFGVRQFRDIDLLVSKRDAYAAVKALGGLGLMPFVSLNDKSLKKYIRLKSSIELLDKTGNISLDLHWDLSGGYLLVPYGIETIEHRICKSTLLNTEISFPAVEDVFLYLCIHGVKDNWAVLERMYCIAWLIYSHPELNWGLIKKQAQVLRCLNVLYYSIFLAHKIMGCGIPEIFKGQMLPLQEKFENWCLDIFEDEDPDKEKGWRFSFIHTEIRDNYADKLRHLFKLGTIPSSTDFLDYSLSEPFMFLYFFIRPVRLLFDFAASKLKHS